jgi:hypothetical protein
MNTTVWLEHRQVTVAANTRGSAATYATRTQAYRRRDALRPIFPAAYVAQWGRPFFVVLTPATIRKVTT